jgi:hypothetical protein
MSTVARLFAVFGLVTLAVVAYSEVATPAYEVNC